MLYKHKCSPCNYFEKVMLDRDEVQSQCLQVEIANSKSNAIYKKRDLQLNEFTR